MPSDPFASVQAGQDVSFSATAWNAMLGAGRAWRDGRTGRDSGELTTTRSSSIVRVRNDTGADLGRCAVVGLAGPIFTPTDDEDAFLREVAFSGVSPAASHRGRFAVLMGPALDGHVAMAWVAGVCQVRVDLVDLADDRADVVAGSTGRLVSGTTGSAQILWAESDDAYYGYTTGEQWAIVRLGAHEPGGLWGYLPEGDTITGASGMTLGHGTVTLCTRSGYVLDDSYGDDVEVMNAGGEVTAGTGGRVIKIARMDDGGYSLDVFPCE